MALLDIVTGIGLQYGVDLLVGAIKPEAPTAPDAQVYVVPYRAFGPNGDDAGAVVATATFEEVHHDSMEITSHPIEQGAPISDHAFKMPAEVVVKFGFSDSVGPDGAYTTGDGQVVQSSLAGAGLDQLKAVYQQLLEMMQNRVLLEVWTGKRYYFNMLLKDLAVTTDQKNENVLNVTATFKQVLIVATTLIDLTAAPAEDQEFPEQTVPPSDQGSKQLEEDTPGFDEDDAGEACFPEDYAEDGTFIGEVTDTITDVVSSVAGGLQGALEGFSAYAVPFGDFAQKFEIQLAGATRNLGINFNTLAQSWVLDIADSAGVPLLQGLPLVTGVDLLSQFDYLGIGGKLIAQTIGDSDLVPTAANLGKLGQIYFLASNS